eukprot:GFYU01002839.1.p1 GENE.GFYU01002839.1~~GFYU01002839.1.p1  ORF type:complete len:225 (-),score=25.07 GFYU01002839.1:277-912(-)
MFRQVAQRSLGTLARQRPAVVAPTHTTAACTGRPQLYRARPLISDAQRVCSFGTYTLARTYASSYHRISGHMSSTFVSQGALRKYSSVAANEAGFTIEPASEDEIDISESCVERIQELSTDQGKDVILKAIVIEGGCYGFEYEFSEVTVDELEEGDRIFEKSGAKVAVDSISMDLMKGSEIDYVNELIVREFQVKNPRATGSCGCHKSFSA